MQQQDLIHPLSETAKMHKTMIFFKGKWALDNEEEIKGTEVNDNQTQGRKGTCCQGQACPLSGAELKIQCYENISS